MMPLEPAEFDATLKPKTTPGSSAERSCTAKAIPRAKGMWRMRLYLIALRFQSESATRHLPDKVPDKNESQADSHLLVRCG